MRISLPVRIFVLHVVFMVGVGWFAYDQWTKTLERGVERWQENIATVIEEREFGPVLNEFARALFVQLEPVPLRQTLAFVQIRPLAQSVVSSHGSPVEEAGAH